MTFTVWHIVGACIVVAIVVAVIATLRTRHKDIKKVAYMMDALEDGELNFRFQDKNKFNRTLDENGQSELDIKAGLETISDSSKNLIEFVQTYRQLSGVAKPIRRALDLQELMDNVIALNSELAASYGAVCTYRPEEPDLMIYADEGQISQILINLIKNALQAGAKHVDITAGMGKDDDVIVRVANDGEPIPVSAQEQIFIPFFTTKKEGSGIGLSLSRQIMRNHNGTIELLRSNAQQTVFELRFR